MKIAQVEKRQVLMGVGIVLFSVFLVLGALGVRYLHSKKAQPLPGFEKILKSQKGVFTDLAGASVDLATYHGKPIVLVAWASWCPSCGDQLAMLSRISREEHVSFPILAIDRKETLETANDYLQFVHMPEGLVYVVDKEDLFFKTASGYAMPELIYYDSQGKEIYHHRGTLTEAEIRDIFSQVH